MSDFTRCICCGEQFLPIQFGSKCIKCQEEVPDYEVCNICNFDHSYEPSQAFVAHQALNEDNDEE